MVSLTACCPSPVFTSPSPSFLFLSLLPPLPPSSSLLLSLLLPPLFLLPLLSSSPSFLLPSSSFLFSPPLPPSSSLLSLLPPLLSFPSVPHQWTKVPLPVKVLKLLISDIQNAIEAQTAGQGEEEDEQESDEEVVSQHM